MMDPKVPYEVLEEMLKGLAKHQVHDHDIPLTEAIINLRAMEVMYGRLKADAGTGRVKMLNALEESEDGMRGE